MHDVLAVRNFPPHSGRSIQIQIIFCGAPVYRNTEFIISMSRCLPSMPAKVYAAPTHANQSRMLDANMQVEEKDPNPHGYANQSKAASTNSAGSYPSELGYRVQTSEPEWAPSGRKGCSVALNTQSYLHSLPPQEQSLTMSSLQTDYSIQMLPAPDTSPSAMIKLPLSTALIKSLDPRSPADVTKLVQALKPRSRALYPSYLVLLQHLARLEPQSRNVTTELLERSGLEARHLTLSRHQLAQELLVAIHLKESGLTPTTQLVSERIQQLQPIGSSTTQPPTKQPLQSAT